MLLEPVYIQRVMEAIGRLWNVIKDNGKGWKVMEGNGRL